MSKTIVIFGAGTGLGISTARRIGREGYQVALIGRRAPALDARRPTEGGGHQRDSIPGRAGSHCERPRADLIDQHSIWLNRRGRLFTSFHQFVYPRH